MACHAVPLGNSSQLYSLFLFCCITVSCCYKLFMLISHLVTALAYSCLCYTCICIMYSYHTPIQLLCHTVATCYAFLYNHYVKYLHYRFFHCLMRNSCSIHSFSAAKQWPVHPSIIKWYLGWQPQQSQFHQIHTKQSKRAYSAMHRQLCESKRQSFHTPLL